MLPSLLPFNTSWIALLSLMNKRLEELTEEDLSLVATTIGVEIAITDELKTAAIALLRGEGIDKAGDLIKSPESIAQLVSLFRVQEMIGGKDAELAEVYHGTYLESDPSVAEAGYVSV